jgi:hypothetical protein
MGSAIPGVGRGVRTHRYIAVIKVPSGQKGRNARTSIRLPHRGNRVEWDFRRTHQMNMESVRSGDCIACLQPIDLLT